MTKPKYEYTTTFILCSEQKWCIQEVHQKPPYDRENELNDLIDKMCLSGWEPVSHTHIPANPSSGGGVSVIFKREVRE
jgi:hypothetical protein